MKQKPLTISYGSSQRLPIYHYNRSIGSFCNKNPAHIDAQVDYMLGKLDVLSLIVVDEPFLIKDDQEASFRHERIKSFAKPRLEGPKIRDWSILGPSICYKTQKFAEVWLQAIRDTKDQVNLIRNMHKSVVINSTSRYKSEDDKFKIKMNISIDQVTYLFFLFVKTGIIDLPKRKTAQLINWISENLQSKYCEANTRFSVKNKYYGHELFTLDFWEKKCLELLEIIRLERENLLKFTPK